MSRALQNIAYTGLSAAKKNLETTAHNVANANTEGYSRQKVHLQANLPVGLAPIIRGTGVKVKEIRRVHDELVAKEVRDAESEHNWHKERSLLLSQVESIFNEIEDEGLNKTLNNFFNSFRELANQPENETIRSIVREKAKGMVDDFKRIHRLIDDMENHLGLKMYKNVQNLNVMAEEIALLNKQIAQVEVGTGQTGDLRDQRDRLVKEISKIAKVTVYNDEQGRFVVNLKGVGSLVAGGTFNALKTSRVSKDKATNNKEGATEIYFAERGTDLPISSNFKRGELGAIFEIRNTQLKKLKDDLDYIAFNMGNMVNTIHRRGYAQKPMAVDQNGDPISSPRGGPFTGIDFFKVGRDIEGSSRSIDLSDEVKDDLSNISTGLSPNKSGDNRVALAISKIQHEKILRDGTTTLEEEYLKSIGNLGLETKKSRFDEEQTNGLLAQVSAIRERVSGVSLDEEAADMVKFQHAYEAAAKVMKTAGVMFDAVINIMN